MLSTKTNRGKAFSLSYWISLFVLGISLLPFFLPGPAEGKEKYREVAVSKGAAIAGEAIFKGPPPEAYVFRVDKDTDVFGEVIPDERLIVSPAGKIKYVLVTIEGIMAGKPWPDLKPRIQNKGGRFIPHFQAARTKTKLEIINEDPVLHNTHAIIKSRTLFNLSQPIQGQVIRKTLRRSGLVQIMCDTHDWMNAWIAVLDHPYYAITGADGAYKINNIPAGTYKLTAWHEKLGRRQVEVAVKAGEETKLNFEFPAE